MKKPANLQDAYFRFTKLCEAVEKAPGFPGLDDLERKLLHSIAEASRSAKPVLVGDLIFSNPIGSPATLSRRISSLHNKKLIQYGEDSDGRKKHIELTPKSEKYFERLGEILVSACNKSK